MNILAAASVPLTPVAANNAPMTHSKTSLPSERI